MQDDVLGCTMYIPDENHPKTLAMIIVAGYAALKHTNGWNDNKPKAWPTSNCTGGLIAIIVIPIVIVIIIIIVVIIIIDIVCCN